MKLIKQFILKRPAEKRLTYFFAMVATDEQVWLLRDKNNGDLLLLDDEDEGEYEFLLPVWPSRSFAEMEADKIEHDSFEAFNMPLSSFLDELLVDIENDGGIAVIFPNGKDSTVQERSEIKDMISKL